MATVHDVTSSLAITNTNNVKDLDLTLLENSDLGELVETLRHYPFVESVDISCPNNGRTHPQVSWNNNNNNIATNDAEVTTVHDLFATIGALPHLKKIQCKFLGGGDQDNPVPLSLFTALLNYSGISSQQKTQLESFRLILVGPISCPGGIQDMSDFSQALRHQGRLKDVRLSSCYLSHESLQPSLGGSSLMDAVFQALSTLPSLESVHIKAANRGHLGRLQADSVRALLLGLNKQHPSFLKKLHLDNMVLDHSHVAMIAKALTAPISIFCDTPGTVTTPTTTTTSLEDLYLNLSGVTPLDPTLLPTALRTNRNLRRLHLRLSPQDTVATFLVNTAMALRDNETLQAFGLHGSGICTSEDIDQAFAEALAESNCVLESLDVPSTYEGGWRDRINMFLHLNGRGRQRLLRHADSISKEEWIQLFAKYSATNSMQSQGIHGSGINFVYYYMRVVGPLLMCK